MRSPGEIEAAVAAALARFAREFIGRGPQDIQVRLLDDRVLVHLRGVLSRAEQRLIDGRDEDGGHGAELVRQLRGRLVHAGRGLLDRLVEEATGSHPVGLHHDLSAATGDEVIVFTLAAAPACRSPRGRRTSGDDS
jgi:uncharacterized protein YbcI